LAALALILALPASSLGAPPAHPNPASPKVSPAAAGVTFVPLINSGQTFAGTTFEGIPDGLGVVPVGSGNRFLDLFVAFEQSHVPFGGFADFEDSSVQVARFDLRTRQIVDLDEVLPPSAGFVRFCSAFMAGPREGFKDYTFMVNEESVDWLPIPDGAPYGADPFSDALAYPFRQAGYSVYLDTKKGDYNPIPAAGRLNHENTVIVPGGWDDIVSLSGDDTFAAPSSQLYMYSAAGPDAFLASDGTLLAFRVTHDNGVEVDEDDPGNHANDFLDISAGDVFRGEFIEVDPEVANGQTSDPPQTALENWSNGNNVFQFVRVEDIAYDPDDPNVVYFTDTGSSRIKEGPSGRLIRPSDQVANRPWFNSDGRVFKMVLNEDDPTIVDSLTILAEGRLTISNPDLSTTEVVAGVGLLNPDNLAVGHNGIMVQEDASTVPTNNDVWFHSFLSANWVRVATVTQALAETSGIVDMSSWLGAGWWLLDVQSHENLLGTQPGGTWGDEPATEPIYPLGPVDGTVYQLRREDGQLLLMHVPGS
jgi:hypothetical protein